MAVQTLPAARDVSRQFLAGRDAARLTRSDRAARGVSIRDFQEHQLKQFLGWFSIGLGLAEVAAPETVARLIGVRDHDGWLPMFGIREIASGIGVLSQKRPATGLWSRVAGDAMDLAYLTTAASDPQNDRAKLALAAAAVLGVTVLDVLAAEQHSSRPRALKQRSAPRSDVLVRKNITINRSAEELYNFWHNFENLPRFMHHLQRVVVDGNRSHWEAKSPFGGSVEWDAEITEDVPNERIAWRTTGGDLQHAGMVCFRPAPGGRGTEMRVELSYSPPGGAAGVTIARLLGEDPDFQIQEDLRRFKQVIETGEFPTTEGQPSARGRSLIPGL